MSGMPCSCVLFAQQNMTIFGWHWSSDCPPEAMEAKPVTGHAASGKVLQGPPFFLSTLPDKGSADKSVG